jgi:hypothetical protein
MNEMESVLFERGFPGRTGWPEQSGEESEFLRELNRIGDIAETS